MLRGPVTASLIGYVLLMHVKEFGQLLIGISSLLEKRKNEVVIPLYDVSRTKMRALALILF